MPLARLPEPAFKARVSNGGCGREAVSNIERQFWQSRMVKPGNPVPDPPELIDIRELARQIRRAA